MNNESFKNIIDKSESILIIAHVNPDGDTLGTMTALHVAIKNNFGKHSDMVTMGKVPDIFSFLPCIEDVKQPADLDSCKVYDVAIAVDVAAKDRMVAALKFFDNAKASINIDHHKTNKHYGSINFVNSGVCCSGEVLFDILEDLNLDIDKDTATALYTAFMTDTGGFRYENTKAETLQKAARIINYGAEPFKISRYCYDSMPKSMIFLQASSILNANFIENDRIVYVCLTDKDLEKFNAENDHIDGLVELLRRIKTTEVSFVLKEIDENTVKASIRSKKIDVSAVAEVFGGGGHTFASGCTIHKPINIAADKLIEEIKKYL
jgi:phosphoesterase RecJ-like protein